jgi:general stress protein 26
MDKSVYNKIRTYIDQHPIAILGTINADGSPHGAVVYVCTDNNEPFIYFITKQKTRKYQNLSDCNQVSLTIVDPEDNSTMQANGRVFDVQDPTSIDTIMKKIAFYFKSHSFMGLVNMFQTFHEGVIFI